MPKELEVIIDHCKTKIEEIESFIEDNNLLNIEVMAFNYRLEAYREIIEKVKSLMEDAQ